MFQYYLINDTVEFWPERHQLIVKAPVPRTLNLNVPTSRCLLLLIEQRPQAVMQRDFYGYVWGEQGRKVSVNALYQNIALLRKHFRLLDIALENIVVTLPKQGFQLNETLKIEEIAIVEEDISAALLDHVDDAAQSPVWEKVERFPGRQIAYVIALLLLILLLSVTFILGNKIGFEISTPRYPTEYFNLTTRNGCHYFINKKDGSFDLNSINKSIEAQCNINPYIYISLNEYSAASSVLACKNSINDDEPDCSIYTFIKR
ncbi:hypothetical protein MUA04_17455 [Enterobacteriaceae bacterium H11S18]|uniref:winged helix-turn-helix domain-containing protein n=1 Tax=Dryocola clanedunensis TaxID=2925396 RepID=UPI0022F0DE88|nr:hypothetical protein [Dryocola clanedunensis]MCT4704811.1 hypothetical protein [Dryocola clanedunensis]MCT4711961.1 hypothetical protein [Dryocola clanedunensis]